MPNIANILLSEQTRDMVTSFSNRPTHAVILYGEYGTNTVGAADYLVQLIKSTSPDTVVTTIKPDEKNLISIETIRSLRTDLKLKNSATGIHRIVVIQGIDAMQAEAQNAILKILEEPPVGSLLVMTTESYGKALQTITSRCVQIPVLPVSITSAADYFAVSQSDIETNYAIARGLAGTLTMLQSGSIADDDAISYAKKLLGYTLYEKLAAIEADLKKRPAVDMCMLGLKHVVHAAMVKNPTKPQWQKYMASILKAQQRLEAHVQTKLVLTELFIALG